MTGPCHSAARGPGLGLGGGAPHASALRAQTPPLAAESLAPPPPGPSSVPRQADSEHASRPSRPTPYTPHPTESFLPRPTRSYLLVGCGTFLPDHGTEQAQGAPEPAAARQAHGGDTAAELEDRPGFAWLLRF